MPTFSEYLLAPWKLFVLLWDSAALPFAGYEIPTFIVGGSIAIATIFGAFSFRMLKQSFELKRDLESLSKRLHAENESQPDLKSLRALFAGRPALEEAWERFESGLLEVPAEGQWPLTTQSIDESFSQDELMNERLDTRLYGALPGVLTGLGLLMTFVAILEGLSHVSVTSSMDVRGIGGLINGLSGKFVSSIVAVSCAVLFVFVERLAHALPSDSHRALTRALSRRFKRKPIEALLLEIKTQLAAQALLTRELLQARAEPAATKNEESDWEIDSPSPAQAEASSEPIMSTAYESSNDGDYTEIPASSATDTDTDFAINPCPSVGPAGHA